MKSSSNGLTKHCKEEAGYGKGGDEENTEPHLQVLVVVNRPGIAPVRLNADGDDLVT